MDLKEIEILNRLLKPLDCLLRTAPLEVQYLPLSYDLLLELHTTLYKYREALELRLSACTFIDTVMPEATTFSQIHTRESMKRLYCRRYHKQIEMAMGVIEPLETILAENCENYNLPKELLSKIRVCLAKYFSLLKRIEY